MPPPSARNLNGLPYKSHPLFKLRIATVVTTVVGCFLDIIAICALLYNDEQDIPYFLFSFVLLFVSLTFVLHDLNTYAAHEAASRAAQQSFLSSCPRDQNISPTCEAQAENDQNRTPEPDFHRTHDDPHWPSKRLLITDLILALLFQWLFWLVLGAIMGSYRSYYSRGVEMLEAYANLANLAASIEHAIAFWKELMARKRIEWQREVDAVPCANCGHVQQQPAAEADAAQETPAAAKGKDEERASLLGAFTKGKTGLPRWARGPDATPYKDEEKDIESRVGETAVDEGLLVTPDESTKEVGGPSGSRGYGTLEGSVESVGSVPQTVVRKKVKGKKRLVEVD